MEEVRTGPSGVSRDEVRDNDRDRDAALLLPTVIELTDRSDDDIRSMCARPTLLEGATAAYM